MDPNQVAVFLNQGDKTFGQPRLFQAGQSGDTVTAVAVADVASPGGGPDGNLDLIVVDDSPGVTIWLGDGNGNFTPGTFGPTFNDDPIEYVGVAVGDFDRNGAPDLALLDSGDFVFFACNTGGTFAACSTASLDTNGTHADRHRGR